MERLVAPIKALRLEYIPLLIIYFVAGFAAFDSVASTFFFKNIIKLDAKSLIGLGIWTSLPWSIKMVFGSLIDSVPIFGSNRKSYIYLGSALMFMGDLIFLDLASIRLVYSFIGEYGSLLLSGLLITSGIVMADIVADTMQIEVVKDGPERMKDLGMVQVLSRMALSIGAVMAALITGYLASNYSYSTIFALKLFLPIIIVIATFFTKLNIEEKPGKLDLSILLGGLGFGAFCVLSGMFFGQHGQLAVFVVSMVVINYMLIKTTEDMDPNIRSKFFLACIAIFLFRTIPGVGPGFSWWAIEALKFDANFLGTLRIISSVSSLLVLWLLSSYITEGKIFYTMLWLIVIGTIMSLPEIGVFMGIHEQLGLTARQVFLIDTGIEAPLGGLSMVPLGVLIAKNAPPTKRAVYISLTASFMNIALVGGDIITKYLNSVLIVTRDNFNNLGLIMVVSLTISTIFSIIGLIFLRKER